MGAFTSRIPISPISINNGSTAFPTASSVPAVDPRSSYNPGATGTGYTSTSGSDTVASTPNIFSANLPASTYNPSSTGTGYTATTGSPNTTQSTGSTVLANGTPSSAPATPTFNSSSTYVPSGSTTNPGTTTASLDSYLQSAMRTYYNPTAQENGTASSDPTQALTQLANNYLQQNPGAGSQSDVQNLVSQYAGQYNNWASQYQSYLKGQGSNISLPALGQTPYTGGIDGNGNYVGNAPASAFTGTTIPNNLNSLGTTASTPQTNNTQSSTTTPQSQYSTVQTPLGYTQYQSTAPQTSNGGISLSSLLSALGYGQSSTGQSSTQNTSSNNSNSTDLALLLALLGSSGTSQQTFSNLGGG